MRSVLVVALLATLACLATAKFRGPIGEVFNTWNNAESVKYVDSFDHLAPLVAHPSVHENEHVRKKRNAHEAARYAASAPITGSCDRPGYTGQYCEFPICMETNFFNDPTEFATDDGYYTDVTDLGNCSRTHEILVDETMEFIHIEVQSLWDIYPTLIISDADGTVLTPDAITNDKDRVEAFFRKMKPGSYLLTPLADDMDSRCIMITTAQTIMTISGGFSTDDRDRNDFPNRLAGAHQFNSILLHLNGARSPAELKTIEVIGSENYVFRPRLLDKRYSCMYEYYFDSMFCPGRGSFAMIVEGVDFNGNRFRRAAPFLCSYLPGDSTPAPPSTSPAPTNPTGCNNGGIIVNSGGKTSCVCQDHWTGYDCSQPLCINGGTLIENKCFCPNGFEGQHCENVKCEPNTVMGFGVDVPTLVLVIRVRSQMNEIVSQVWEAVDQVVANLQFDPRYLTRFQIVFFNNYNTFQSKHYTSIEAVDLDFLKATITTDTTGNCTDAVLGALATGLTSLDLTAASTVYVITDALADDYDQNLNAILEMNSYWKATINFVYVEPSPDSKCVSDVDDPGFRAFDNIANQFGGLAWHVDDRSMVYNVVYAHMNSILYRSQLMLTVDRDECGNGLGKVVQIEKSNDNLVIISKGRSFFPNIITPDGKHLSFDELDVVIQQDYFAIWRVPNPIPGAYAIKFTTVPATASCSVRAYQASFQTLSDEKPTEVFWGITTDVDKDAILYQPLAGPIDNHPVFHIENFGLEEDYDHAFAFLNMYAVRGGVEMEVYAANGFWRNDCSFHFYFPSFRCRPDENLHFEFNLRNEDGFYIQRAGVMHCFNSIPTPRPPTECQHGGVMANGTCLCQPHYSGSHCENIICENGGTAMFGFCSCSAGWTGLFCDIAQCTDAAEPPNFGYNVDMAFLVEVTKRGVGQIQALSTGIQEIIRDAHSQHPDWIDRVVLIGYNSSDIIGMVDAPITAPSKIYDALNAWGASNPSDDGCVVQVWEAIYQLIHGRSDGPNPRQLPDRSIINIFEASIPDNLADPKQAIKTSEELLEYKTITNVFQMRSDTSEWVCNGNQTDFIYLEQAARRGDGKMYTLSNDDIPKAIRMIPTLFSSSIVYKYHADDCTAGHNVFFPVDAYTQTVSAIVFGYKATVDLLHSNGAQFDKEGRIEIFRNDEQQVIEYRNTCDDDWQPLSQYCMYFNAAPNYVQAWGVGSVYCAAQNGFLTDDMSQEKHDWLTANMGNQKAWLGLIYQNDKWQFQSDGGTLVPVPSGINFWKDGKVPNGNSGTCAYFDQGFWYPADCNSKYRVVCQKHMFDSNNEPSNIDDDDLAPGKYYLQVTTDGPNQNGWKGCDVEVRVQSDLNVEFGFVDDLRKDEVHPVANVDSDANRVASTISIGKERTFTSLLKSVQIRSDDDSSTLLEAANFQVRFGCVYDFISQPFTCEETNGDDFSTVLIGIDDTGNTFQRYSTSLCYKWQVCFNGGVYSNGACLCPDYYTGPDCRTPLCQNGGTPAATGRKCHCTSGFGGDSCQYVQCDSDSQASFTNEGKALVLVIEKSENTVDAIRSLADNFKDIYNKMLARSSTWIDKILIETFTSSGDIEDLALYNDVDALIDHLRKIADESADLPGACMMPIWNALGDMFGNAMTKYLAGSEVVLISAGPPLDADIDSVHAAMENFDTQTPVLDFIHVETVQCNISDWTKGLGDFANFVSSTGGTMFRANQTHFGQGMAAFLPTRYAAQRLSASDNTNCQQNNMYIQIDAGITDFYVMVGGQGASTSIMTPTNLHQDVEQIWTSDEQSLWHVSPQYPGIYSVLISSTGQACFPVVYGSGGAQIFMGFIQDNNRKDTPKPYAVYGVVNYPVFYLLDSKNSNQSTTETIYMADMTRQSFTGLLDTPYTSDVDQRVGCSYNYVGKAFTCQFNNEYITLSASGVDAYNQVFTRQTSSWCKTDNPTTGTTKPPTTGPTTSAAPTTPAPTPGTIQFDILFIVDETEDESFLPDVAEPFIDSVLSIFTTSQRYARVGLITMPQKAGLSMPVAFLSSIDSVAALNEDLISLEDFHVQGTNEYLTQALQFANDPLKYRQEEHGYRSQINNHVIVLLTAKNKFADKDGAMTEIQKIIKDNTYGLIAVGYGNAGDWSDLSDIAGDCVETASNKDALINDVAPFIQTKIWNATFNGGMYCAPSVKLY